MGRRRTENGQRQRLLRDRLAPFCPDGQRLHEAPALGSPAAAADSGPCRPARQRGEAGHVRSRNVAHEAAVRGQTAVPDVGGAPSGEVATAAALTVATAVAVAVLAIQGHEVVTVETEAAIGAMTAPATTRGRSERRFVTELCWRSGDRSSSTGHQQKQHQGGLTSD